MVYCIRVIAMNHKPMPPYRIFAGVLYTTALVLLAADNYTRLLLCMVLYGFFVLVSMLQSVLYPAGKAFSPAAWVFPVIRFGLVGACLILTDGLGAAFLFYILEMDLCFRHAPLPSGIASVALLGALLAFSPFTQAVWALHITVFTAIFLLAHSVKKEQESTRSLTENLSALRVQEKRLADLNAQMERMNEKLEEATRQEERSRILKGIHDTLGYTLTTIIVQLSAALTLLDKDASGVRNAVATARNQAKEGLGSVRETIRIADESGLPFRDKIRRTINEAEKSMDIRVLTVMDDAMNVPEDIEQTVLSSVREGLTNGVRHGRATAFLLKVEQKPDGLHCYLEDNGSGCTDLHMGYGLTAMEERVEQSGGRLEAGGIPDGGFMLKITLPANAGEGES